MATMTPLPLPDITLRPALPADAAAIRTLATLDSSTPPSGPLLLAFESGTPPGPAFLRE